MNRIVLSFLALLLPGLQAAASSVVIKPIPLDSPPGAAIGWCVPSDGKLIAAVVIVKKKKLFKKDLFVWNRSDGKLVTRVPLELMKVKALSLSEDGRSAAIVGQDYGLEIDYRNNYVWRVDLEKGKVADPVQMDMLYNPPTTPEEIEQAFAHPMNVRHRKVGYLDIACAAIDCGPFKKNLETVMELEPTYRLAGDAAGVTLAVDGDPAASIAGYEGDSAWMSKDGRLLLLGKPSPAIADVGRAVEAVRAEQKKRREAELAERAAHEAEEKRLLEKLKKEAAMHPGEPKVHLELAKTLIGRGFPEAAAAEFSRAIKADPSSAEAYFQRGALRLLTGKLDAALADASSALGIDGALGKARVLKGRVLEAKNRDDDALAEFNAALQTDRHDIQALNYRGLLKLKKGNSQEAAEDFSEAWPYIELPGPEIRCLVAAKKLESGDLNGADSASFSARDRDPKSACGWFYSGLVALQRGYNMDAARELGQARDLAPGDPAIAKYAEQAERADRADINRIIAEAHPSQTMGGVSFSKIAISILEGVNSAGSTLDAHAGGTSPDEIYNSRVKFSHDMWEIDGRQGHEPLKPLSR